MEAIHKFLLALVFLAFINMEEALGAQHSVTWDESTDYDSWASGQTFKVGDQLAFKYAAGLHNVVELGSESAYKSCDVSSPVDSSNGGNTVIKLNKAGTRYFACGAAGHCGLGMKVKITTVAADSSSPSTPASSSSSGAHVPRSFAPPTAVLMAASLVLLSFFLVF